MIMEYKVISTTAWTVDTAIRVLEKKVNDLLQQGWEPLGGIMIVALNESVYQTLIKRDTIVKNV
jgi:hypothetical protein